MKLPKQDKLVIPIEKLAGYALNAVREPNKSVMFKSALGFEEKDAGLLAEKIRIGVSIFTATPKLKDDWGQRYQVIMRITGNGKKTANVLTAWIDDENTGEMRLTTVYITKREVFYDDTDKTV